MCSTFIIVVGILTAAINFCEVCSISIKCQVSKPGYFDQVKLCHVPLAYSPLSIVVFDVLMYLVVVVIDTRFVDFGVPAAFTVLFDVEITSVYIQTTPNAWKIMVCV